MPPTRDRSRHYDGVKKKQNPRRLPRKSREAARVGFYAASVAVDVGQDRLKRFLVSKEGGLIRKEIRELSVFAVQDPPFTKIDLLSCRNPAYLLESPTATKTRARCFIALSKPTVSFF
jgi:hypothetical protein